MCVRLGESLVHAVITLNAMMEFTATLSVAWLLPLRFSS